ncbi:hypothetical protein FDG09_09965 [Clostridium sporogenes]|uniref:hypothetical protein n=1 Tax=Clostridium sporogenes TaxID=1509 RepID=UPI0013D07357|nr:hypothetical protein [Clostridium sporogenes]NFV13243.1 hypothetical protein [Clostridium sporogenes]
MYYRLFQSIEDMIINEESHGEDPFRTVGNLSALFKDNRNEAISIMGKVAEIKTNAKIIT